MIKLANYRNRWALRLAALLPSGLKGKVEDFDKIEKYVIRKEAFKSWNDDPSFKENGLNAIYFKYTKPCKVQVDFITSILVGVVDIVSWSPQYPKYELKPTVLHFHQLKKGSASFQFYANPFFLNRKEGFFEPRVYPSLHMINEIRITKLASFRNSKECEYALFLLKRAKEMLDISEENYLTGDCGFSIHFARFAIELSLKSIYPMFGMFWVAKRHDVDFPPDLRKRVSKIILRFPFSRLLWISQHHLRPDRIDFYGDEISFIPPYEVVNRNEAKNSFR